METYFFKKLIPQNGIYLANGKKFMFDTADGVWGFTLTSDPALAHQIHSFMQKGIGDISVASAEEYEEFIKKKRAERYSQTSMAGGADAAGGNVPRKRKKSKCCGGR